MKPSNDSTRSRPGDRLPAKRIAVAAALLAVLGACQSRPPAAPSATPTRGVVETTQAITPASRERPRDNSLDALRPKDATLVPGSFGYDADGRLVEESYLLADGTRVTLFGADLNKDGKTDKVMERLVFRREGGGTLTQERSYAADGSNTETQRHLRGFTTSQDEPNLGAAGATLGSAAGSALGR